MSNGFSFDTDQALDGLAFVTQANDARGFLTLYAVVCAEHGGIIMRDAAEALAGAQAANDNAPADHACKYVPLALSLDPRALPKFPGEDIPDGA